MSGRWAQEDGYDETLHPPHGCVQNILQEPLAPEVNSQLAYKLADTPLPDCLTFFLPAVHMCVVAASQVTQKLICHRAAQSTFFLNVPLGDVHVLEHHCKSAGAQAALL